MATWFGFPDGWDALKKISESDADIVSMGSNFFLVGSLMNLGVYFGDEFFDLTFKAV
jgi:hypothetical protein